jgi:hypothetical protein
VPAATVEGTVKVAVELPLPGAAIDVGLKLTVTSTVAPLEDNATGELNPFSSAVVIVEVAEPPADALTEVGAAEIVKSGAGVTVKFTVVLCVSPPPVPVMVIG